MAFGSNVVDGFLKNHLVRSFLQGRGIDDQILNLLGANATVGQPTEVMFPMDLLPITLRLLGMGLLNFQVANTHRDWVWPWFLTRQLDPDDEGYAVRGHSPMYLNMHYRNWTGIGVFGHPDEAIVDPAGLLTPRLYGWSLDVWVKTPAGRWVFPSRCYKTEAEKPRQVLQDSLPIVITTTPLDDDHHLEVTAFAHDDDQTQLACLRARVLGPQAAEHDVLITLRPYNPEGLTQIKQVALNHQHWVVEGEPAVVFDREPVLQGAGNFTSGDVAIGLQKGRVDFPREVTCRSGLVTAFALFREKAAVHVAMAPVTATEESIQALGAKNPDDLLHEAAENWKKELAGTPQLTGVDEKTQQLYDACKSWVLLVYDPDPFSDKDQITPGPFTYHHFWFRDCAYLTTALDRLGRHDLAERILYTYPHRQTPDGFFKSQEGEWDANGQAIWTQFQHYLLTRSEKYLREMYPSMSRGAKWVTRKRRRGKRDEGGLATGLLPAGMSAEHLGSNDYYYWDDFWCLRGLLDTAMAASILGKEDEAQHWLEEAEAFRRDIETSLEKAADRLGEKLLPASPLVRLNSGAIGSLAAVYPTEVLAASDERVLNTVEGLREISFHRGAFFQHIFHSGVNIYLSLQVAQCELRNDNPRHHEIWNRLLQLASPTWTYPEGVHPRTGGGCMGDGHHTWAASECLHYVHSLFVIEQDERLDLLRGLDPVWFAEDGHTVSLGPLPTHFGVVSLSARRQGDQLHVSLSADWKKPPGTLRVYSPANPGQHQDFSASAQEMTVVF